LFLLFAPLVDVVVGRKLLVDGLGGILTLQTVAMIYTLCSLGKALKSSASISSFTDPKA
jgi:hypothetical protein